MPEPRRNGRRAGRRANGEGSIYWEEASQRYRGALTIGLDAHGKPIRRRVTGRTRNEVKARLDALAEQSQRVDLSGRMPTVAEWAALWLDTVNAERAPSTVPVVRTEVTTRIIDDPIGRHRLDRLHETHVDAWLRAHADRGDRAPTIANHRRNLGQIMQWAVARRRIPVNPVAGAVTPRRGVTPSTPKRALTIGQMNDLLAVCATDPWGAYFTTCVLLGLRPGEADGMRHSRLDLDARTVHIDTAMKRAKGRPVELGPTKTEHTRTVALPARVAEALERHPAVAGPWADLVFEPCHSSNIRKQLRRVCAAAKVPAVTPYELRHTCASVLLNQGVPMTTVADMLGTSERMLRKHYHHLIDPVILAGAETMDGLVAPPVAPVAVAAD
jgi:integrase